MLTAARAREVLKYIPKTGELTWRVSRGSRSANASAGCIGYNTKRERQQRVVRIDTVLFLTSRVIWLMVTGSWPAHQIDHEDQNPLNEAWENLRDVTNQDNNRNTSLQKNNTSGVMGVYWCKSRKKWCADIKVNRKKIHIGYFKEFDDAATARKAAEIKYGFHPNHGLAK